MKKAVTIIIIVVLAFVIYEFLGINSTPTKNVSTANSSKEVINQKPIVQPRVAPQGYTEYINVPYSFSLFYPSGYKITEYDEGGGGRTITFEKNGNDESYQIFIVPYNLPEISVERFKKDEPSGVRKNVSEVQIDGAKGISFTGQNDILGDSAETWFIQGGYLYEITSGQNYKPLIEQAVSSWKFLAK